MMWIGWIGRIVELWDYKRVQKVLIMDFDIDGEWFWGRVAG